MNGYIDQISKQINDYVAKLITEEPDVFATDGANNRIVKRYFKDIYGVEVSDNEATLVHSLTRSKSKFLEENKHLDKRVKDAPKFKQKKEGS